MGASRLWWKGFVEKASFEPGMKQKVWNETVSRRSIDDSRMSHGIRFTVASQFHAPAAMIGRRHNALMNVV